LRYAMGFFYSVRPFTGNGAIPPGDFPLVSDTCSGGTVRDLIFTPRACAVEGDVLQATRISVGMRVGGGPSNRLGAKPS
jgi:hypothetical protein